MPACIRRSDTALSSAFRYGSSGSRQSRAEEPAEVARAIHQRDARSRGRASKKGSCSAQNIGTAVTTPATAMFMPIATRTGLPFPWVHNANRWPRRSRAQSRASAVRASVRVAANQNHRDQREAIGTTVRRPMSNESFTPVCRIMSAARIRWRTIPSLCRSK